MALARRLCAGIAFVSLAFSAGLAVSADQTIKLGAALSLTGKHAAGGTHTKNGYDLAVRKINDKGGVKIGGTAYELDVLYYDDESTPQRSTVLVERLILEDGVRFILGPYSSLLTKAAVPIIEQHRVPMVEANGASRDVFSRGYRYLFSVLSTSELYLTQVIDLAVAYAAKFGKAPNELTLAIATDDGPFAHDARAGVLASIKEHGVNLVVDDRLPPELDDMSMTLSKVEELKPDMLVVSGHDEGALTAVQQLEALQVRVPMIALTHCDSAQLETKFTKAASHIFCPQQWHRSLKHEGALFGSAEDFARAFETVYGYAPPSQAAQSAAAVYVFADALERAQSLDAEKVRDAIAATDLVTFYGPIKFDEAGASIAQRKILTQIIDGRYVVVAPEGAGGQEPVIPRPAQ